MPSTPASFHSSDCSGGAANIENRRTVSAPYLPTMACGSTPLFFDLDIFSVPPTTTGWPSAIRVAPQVARRFVAVDHPRVAQQLVVEAEIHQVQDRVLDAADVLVDRQPVVAALVDGITRTRRSVAGVVPARLHEGVEGIGFALGRTAALRAGGLAPFRVAPPAAALPAPALHRTWRSRSPESGSPSSAGGSRPSRAGGS
ncbi:hypothetical protein G6F50_014305 [Rhizopus delemar]|uniref:Uncharacterized protein n=1 Tax=Rhizopus delemar TaxID=936053 RepID=A0A9P6Y6Z4_9FUNG|nr:hypothetical protein G6F50_014305 [Rhizopus delemar]